MAYVIGDDCVACGTCIDEHNPYCYFQELPYKPLPMYAYLQT